MLYLHASEHEDAVLETLHAFIRLCARPFAQRVEELCVTRNIVLLGSSALAFLSADEIRRSPHCCSAFDAGSNFALSHGKPASAYMVPMRVIFIVISAEDFAHCSAHASGW